MLAVSGTYLCERKNPKASSRFSFQNFGFIQEWIKRKRLPPKNTDESEKETEKRKADELRQLMAQVVITEFNY